VTYRWVLDWMIGFIETLYTPLGSTGNYSAITIPTLYRSLTHTSVLRLLRSPLVVSWQWINNSLTVISDHT
jgi:hypothetical protein